MGAPGRILCDPETSKVPFGELGGGPGGTGSASREGPEPENSDFGVLLVFPEALQTLQLSCFQVIYNKYNTFSLLRSQVLCKSPYIKIENLL